MSKQKSTLTLAKIKKVQNKYSEYQLFTYSDGETINLNTTYRPSLVEEMLEEYGLLINFFQDEGGLEMSEKEKLFFLYFLILKYFTDLGKEVSDEPALILKQFYDFVDSIYLTELINKGFPKEEVSKIFDKATEVTATYSFLENMTNQLKQQFDDLSTQNENVLANLGNNTQSE